MTHWTSKSIAANALLAFGMLHPTVIPMRDPLASCLSSEARMEKNNGRGRPALAALDQWKFLADVYQLLGTTGQLAWVPWDLPETEQERRQMLDKARLTLGLMDENATARFASQWPITNSIGTYKYKTLYDEKKTGAIKKALPEFWAELRKLEPRLRDWLEVIGYRDLLWWSK
jgi:hypothetical protein